MIIFISALIAASIIYFFLFHDDLMDKRNDLLKLKTKKTEAEKIAKVKALSTNSKDIEKFILENAQTLSDATIDILVARMEMLAVDSVIHDDELKARIDSATIPKEYEPQVPDTIEIVEIPVKRKRK